MTTNIKIVKSYVINESKNKTIVGEYILKIFYVTDYFVIVLYVRFYFITKNKSLF